MTFDSDNENKNEETPVRRRPQGTASSRPQLKCRTVRWMRPLKRRRRCRRFPRPCLCSPFTDVVVFNYMIVPLFVGREQSVQAVEAAATQGRHIFLCARRTGKWKILAWMTFIP